MLHTNHHIVIIILFKLLEFHNYLSLMALRRVSIANLRDAVTDVQWVLGVPLQNLLECQFYFARLLSFTMRKPLNRIKRIHH